MAMRMSERIDQALLSGDVGVFSDAAGGLPVGVDKDDLGGAIMAVGLECGLSALEVDVLFFLVSATSIRAWRGAAAWPRVWVKAVDIARYYQVDVRRVVDAERSLADKGWCAVASAESSGAGGVAGSPRVGSDVDELDLRPLLARWETLCCMVVANFAGRKVVDYLRAAIAWRADGLGQDSALDEVKERGTFATLAELAVECDRLLLSLEVLIGAEPGSADDTQRRTEL